MPFPARQLSTLGSNNFLYELVKRLWESTRRPSGTAGSFTAEPGELGRRHGIRGKIFVLRGKARYFAAQPKELLRSQKSRCEARRLDVKPAQSRQSPFLGARSLDFTVKPEPSAQSPGHRGKARDIAVKPGTSR